MKITYTLNENDIKKLLADHYETTPGDIEIRYPNPNINCTEIEITIETYPE